MTHSQQARFRQLAAMVVGTVAALITVGPVQAAPPSGAGWNLAWNDEFNGTSMDTSKWQHWLSGPRRDAVNSPSAVSVGDGSLTISTYTSGGTHYTGMIATQNTYLYTYGYIEARINYDSTPGMWSAFWMQSPTMGSPIGSPNSAGTEIDICEHRLVDGSNANINGRIVGNIHWDGYGASHRSTGYQSPDLNLGSGYHIYGMEWTPTQQKFYIDGVLRWTINNDPVNSPVSQRSEFIILSSEVENAGWAGSIPAGGYGTIHSTTTKMEVDYVRVYRRAETVVNGDFEGKIGPFSSVNQASWSSTGGNFEPASAKIAPTSGGSSVEQTVRGLLPDTGYSFTAWGNAGTTSPNLFIGAKNYGGAQIGQTLTGNTFAKANVSFNTGATNRSAAVFAYSSSIGSTAYADDFLLRRAETVNHGQLETGDNLAWTSTYGGAAISSDGTNYGGEYAWKIPPSGSSAGVEQEVIGLSPSTAYRLTVWTTNGNAGLNFGVKNHGAGQVTSNVAAGTWTKGTVNFTTGPSNSTATIFAFRNSSGQTSYADSFFLSQPLTSPWTGIDIGSPPLAGTSGRLGDKWVLQACGTNISGTSDKMHFIHQAVTGDATITARMLGVDTTAYYAKAGLMIRESTADDSRSASVTWGPVNQLADFSTRTTNGGSASSSTTARDLTNPPWLRLTRRGNVFTAYSSPDGTAWSRVGTPRTIAMPASTLVGIPVCSGDNARLNEASVDNVTVTQPVPDVIITSPVDGAAIAGIGNKLYLTATVTGSGTPTIAWTKVSGPGTVTFSTPNLATTAATFSTSGTFILRCSATTAAGTGSDDHTIQVTSQPTADPTLVLRVKLDESTGTNATDSSVGNHVGTANGAITWQPSSGMLAGAASFNGTDSFISIPDSPALDGTNAFTLSYWFRANTFNSSGLVAKRVNFNDNNSFSTFLSLDGKLNVDIDSNNNRFTSNTGFERGAWYHIALVFDGSLAADQRAKLYVDGALDRTATETSTSIPNYNATFLIGILNNPTTAYFDGLIDDVRFHRQALTATEISALHRETGEQAPFITIAPPPPAVINAISSLTATAEVDSGPAPTTAWTKVSGPGTATFSNPTSLTTNVSFDQPGEYVLRLTATNAFGQTFAETTVNASLPLPIATITQPPAPVDLANTLHSLRLIVSIATQGVPGTPSITWSQFSGPGITTFADSSAADTTATFSAPGNYILRCTVTNNAGTATADAAVSVATPSTATFREGDDSYSHAATFLRADSANWNSGARDLMLVGKSLNGPAFRTVFSFPLLNVPNNAVLTNVSLNLRTHDSQAGTGTISTLELRPLNDIPTEGIGNSSSDAANGAGTGATWNHRTASQSWTNPGGDFGSTVLSSVPGFNASTLNSSKTFPSTSSFVAAAQSAVSTGQPLSLMLYSPTTESGANNNFIRISSDDHPTSSNRPQLSVSWATNPAPVIDPGIAPAAVRNEPVDLTGSTTGAASSIWSLVSGPGSVLFGNPSQPATTATFSQPGIYQLKLTAIHPNAEVSRSLNLEVTANPAIFSDWQSLTWPGIHDPETIAPNKDPDHDGIDNLLEWALHLDAKTPSAIPAPLAENNGTWEYTYTRRKTAPGEAVFRVEWSESLEGTWSDSGIGAETPESSTPQSETIKVTLPAAPSGKCFVRLRVTQP